MATRTSPTLRRRRLARRVRQLREQAGLTQGEAAAGLDMSTSALSRKETGEVGTSVHEVRSMMDLYDIYEPELLALAREARQKGWWRAYGLDDRGYIDLETEACTVRNFEVTNVPGLLQTKDFARTLFATNRHKSKRWVETATAARMVRHERFLDEDDSLELIAVIDEAALRRPVGGRTVMTEQLAYLTKQAEHPRITIHVLPQEHGAHIAANGAFTLLSFPDPGDPEILFVEHVAGSVQTEKSAEVRASRAIFDGLRTQALDPTGSVDLIDRIRRAL